LLDIGLALRGKPHTEVPVYVAIAVFVPMQGRLQRWYRAQPATARFIVSTAVVFDVFLVYWIRHFLPR
jgi:hypothetical protein